MPSPFAQTSSKPAAKTGGMSKATDAEDNPGRADAAAVKANAARGGVDPRAARASMALGKTPTSFVSITDYADELLAVFPLELHRDRFTSDISGKPYDAIEVDFLVCSGDDDGTEHTSAMVTGSVLVGALSKKIGEAVVLKIGQGEKKKGRNAPWIPLETSDEEDEYVAQKVAAFYGGK